MTALMVSNPLPSVAGPLPSIAEIVVTLIEAALASWVSATCSAAGGVLAPRVRIARYMAAAANATRVRAGLFTGLSK
jgi:hypothetical protein